MTSDDSNMFEVVDARLRQYNAVSMTGAYQKMIKKRFRRSSTGAIDWYGNVRASAVLAPSANDHGASDARRVEAFLLKNLRQDAPSSTHIAFIAEGLDAEYISLGQVSRLLLDTIDLPDHRYIVADGAEWVLHLNFDNSALFVRPPELPSTRGA